MFTHSNTHSTHQLHSITHLPPRYFHSVSYCCYSSLAARIKYYWYSYSKKIVRSRCPLIPTTFCTWGRSDDQPVYTDHFVYRIHKPPHCCRCYPWRYEFDKVLNSFEKREKREKRERKKKKELYSNTENLCVSVVNDSSTADRHRYTLCHITLHIQQ